MELIGPDDLLGAQRYHQVSPEGTDGCSSVGAGGLEGAFPAFPSLPRPLHWGAFV